MTWRRLRCLIAALLLCAACGASTPTGPGRSGARTGAWSGTVADAVNGTGALRVVLDERTIDGDRSLLTGTWTSAFGGASRNGSGTVTGTIAGTAGTLSLNPTQSPTCPTAVPFPAAVGSYTVPALSVSDSLIGGAYVFVTCDGTVPGTLELRR
jgi:hypothetical protein